MKMKKRYIVAVIVVMIIAIFVVHHYVFKLRNAPIINKDQKYFLIIHGNISPQLHRAVHLFFLQTYVGTATQCYHTTNVLAGAEAGPYRTMNYQAVPNSSGSYTVKIPLDKYRLGYCHWVPWTLQYRLLPPHVNISDSAQGNSLISFTKKDTNAPKTYQFSCSSLKARSCQAEIPKTGFLTFSLNRERSSNLKLNIIYRTK